MKRTNQSFKWIEATEKKTNNCVKGETAKAEDTHSYLYWVTEPYAVFIVDDNSKFNLIFI